MEDLKQDCERAGGLSSAERVMVDYAAKLTRDPAAIVKGDVERLRQAGFDDQAILEINLATAYMGFVNRIADGLGVELESSVEGFTRWKKGFRWSETKPGLANRPL